MKLSALELNQKAIITGVYTDKRLKERLYNMGLREGNEIEIIRFAPLLDPIEVYTCGFYLAIRLADAFNVTVEKI